MAEKGGEVLRYLNLPMDEEMRRTVDVMRLLLGVATNAEVGRIALSTLFDKYRARIDAVEKAIALNKKKE